MAFTDQPDVELICNNATVGGRVSVELARLKREGSGPEARSRVVSSGQQGRRKGRTVGGGGGRGGVAKRPVRQPWASVACVLFMLVVGYIKSLFMLVVGIYD